MRVLTFEKNGRARLGVAAADGVVDVSARAPELGGLRQVLCEGSLGRVFEAADGAAADYSLEEITYLPPVPDPEKILCIGVNYVNRNAEYRDDSELPEYPSIFLRTRESMVGHATPIVRPPESDQLDYEGEIAIIIGREGRRIPEARAHEHVAGLTILNEGSIRDWLRHGKFNVTQGKNFERTGSFGPWMVTNDAFDDRYDDLRVMTRVNGETRQDDTTDHLLFPFRYLIAYLSTFMRLKPGDVISTGTPNGAGARFDPPRYLVPGDVVEVEVSGIGILRNEVIDEDVSGG